MTPQPNQTPASSPVTGSPNTTAAGILSIIMGALTMFLQVWGAAHGQAMDPTATTTGVGMIGGGIGLVAAKDHGK